MGGACVTRSNNMYIPPLSENLWVLTVSPALCLNTVPDAERTGMDRVGAYLPSGSLPHIKLLSPFHDLITQRLPICRSPLIKLQSKLHNARTLKSYSRYNFQKILKLIRKMTPFKRKGKSLLLSTIGSFLHRVSYSLVNTCIVLLVYKWFRSIYSTS